MCKLRHHSGFTLLEVLIALVILSIGLLGVAGLTIGIIHGNTVSRHSTTATVIAQSELEDIQRAGYFNATTANFPDDSAIAMGGVTFARTNTITDDDPLPDMKTVTVTVSWENGVRSVALNTIVAQ